MVAGPSPQPALASVEDQSSFHSRGGQRNAYEPQKGIEVDALGALNAVPHIGVNMVKPG
jgi:hypothetical protein